MGSADRRILTTHVGSLVRPPEFAAKLRERQTGGLPDGEYGKSLGWEQYALERMEGFGPRQELEMGSGGSFFFTDTQNFPEFHADCWAHQELAEGMYPCVGLIRYTGHASLKRDIDTLKDAMAPAGVKHGLLHGWSELSFRPGIVRADLASNALWGWSADGFADQAAAPRA
jgi:5-methyltetrahydropteroyltriglutamate--homocysteine methyltransferase